VGGRRRSISRARGSPLGFSWVWELSARALAPSDKHGRGPALQNGGCFWWLLLVAAFGGCHHSTAHHITLQYSVLALLYRTVCTYIQ
jgi:hypothetical protein